MNIKDLMTDDLSKVGEFEAACDDFINSRYILTESKIIKILQIVATSTVLQRIITDALKGFDYTATAGQWNDNTIVIPPSEKDLVALVFCLLADIDNRKIQLSDFLRRFFSKDDINSSFAYFCETLIVPFKNYVVGALGQAQKERLAEDYARLERKVMRLAEVIERYTGFDKTAKDEYILLCDNIATKARENFSAARAAASNIYKRLGGIPEIAPFVGDVVSELGGAS